jgi:hypothetical protein
MALRAADGHESHRPFQSRDREGAVSCRAELVTFYGAVASRGSAGKRKWRCYRFHRVP